MKLFKLCTVTFFVSVACGIVNCQQYQQQGALGSSFNPATTPRPVYPPAQVHYVNIGEDLTGDYKFGYDTGKNGGGQSFREESRHPDGTVKGAYGYVDAEGKQRIVKYTAGIEGFKVESDEAAQAGGAPVQAAAPAAPRTYSPPPQPQQPQQVYRPQPQPQPQQVYQPQPQPQPQQVYRPQPQPQPQQAYRPQSQPQLQELYRSAPALPNYGLPSSGAAQPLGGYTPVSPSQQYAPPAPVQAPSAAYRAPSPLPNYAAISGAQQASRQQHDDGQYRPQSYSSGSVPAYSATLGQRQPTLAQARPAAHLATIPRNQGYQGLSAGFGSSQPQESSTWGPPVINKELLSYNIGTQG